MALKEGSQAATAAVRAVLLLYTYVAVVTSSNSSTNALDKVPLLAKINVPLPGEMPPQLYLQLLLLVSMLLSSLPSDVCCEYLRALPPLTNVFATSAR